MRHAALLLGITLLAPACGKTPATHRAEAPCAVASVGREDGPLPPVGSMQASDATGTGALTVVSTGACTRVTVALLGPNGAGAERAGPLAATFLRSYGILRVPLPAAVTQVAQAESVFEGGLVHAAYVVHGTDGMRLDVHLGAPAKALGAALEGPARLGVELAAGGGAVPAAAPAARNVVVNEPRGGAAAYPLAITGYARTFEANVQAWIEVAGKPVAGTKTHATAADWSTTWGDYALTIPEGPHGDITLFVGEESAQDGTPIGVRIPLRIP